MKNLLNWRLIAILVMAVVLSAALMTPALMTQVNSPSAALLLGDSEFEPQQVILFFLVAAVVSGVLAVLVGHLLERRVGIGAPLLHAWLKGDRVQIRAVAFRLPKMLALGVGLGGLILLIGLAFRGLLPRLPPDFNIPPIWQGVLMMMGAAIREEILFRFGAVNFMLWLLRTAVGRNVPKVALVWTAIVATSLGFAAAHLAAIPDALGLTVQAKILAIGIVTLMGIVLGWVYWRHGLIAAIACHLGAGITLLLGVQGVMAIG